LLVSFCVYWFSDSIADPDLWGHVRFGEDIIRTRSIVHDDTYSYRTGDQQWINHEWLSELIFAGLYRQAGPRGLVVFKVLISILLLWLCHGHLLDQGVGPFSSVFLLVVISLPFRLGMATIRPQLFTYLFFLAQLLILERATTRRALWSWVLPIVYAIWVNLHGGVLAGLGVLGIWIAAGVVERLRHGGGSFIRNVVAAIPLVLLGAACGLALLCNPYRAALVSFLLRKGTVARPEIGEWAPITLMSRSGGLYLILVAAGIAGLVASGRRRKPQPVLIWSTTAVLPLFSQRHYPLFALALVVLAGEHIADVWSRLFAHPAIPSVPSRSVAVISVIFSVALVGLSLPRFACIRIEPYYFAFPARAVAFLRQSGVRGNMAVPFDWGEYVLWHLGPGVKVSIDGRRETVYSDEAYRQSNDFERGSGVWDLLVRTSKTDLVLAPIRSPTANLLSRTPTWAPLYHDSCSVIFVREGFPGLARLVESPVPALPDNGAGLCFPSPNHSHGGAVP
jgi:hypothetical protein